MKRAIIFLILFSMILHCSIRLGLVTWLYQNRQAIAYSVGFVKERPITMCSHKDDLDRAVKFEGSHQEHEKIPAGSFQVREINLFVDGNHFQHYPQFALLCENQLPWVIEEHYPRPEIFIFHPPA